MLNAGTQVTCFYLVHRSVVLGHSKFCVFVFDLQVMAETHCLVLRDCLPWKLWQLMHTVLTPVIKDYKDSHQESKWCFDLQDNHHNVEQGFALYNQT